MGQGVEGSDRKKGAICFKISPNEEVYYVILKREGRKAEADGEGPRTEKEKMDKEGEERSGQWLMGWNREATQKGEPSPMSFF